MWCSGSCCTSEYKCPLRRVKSVVDGAQSTMVVARDVPPAALETCEIADGQRDDKIAHDDHDGPVALLPAALDYTAE